MRKAGRVHILHGHSKASIRVNIRVAKRPRSLSRQELDWEINEIDNGYCAATGLYSWSLERRDLGGRGFQHARDTYLLGVSMFGNISIGSVWAARNSYRVLGFGEVATMASNLSVASRQSCRNWSSRVLSPVQTTESLQ